MRNSKAQIYLSGISSIVRIANIVLRTMGFLLVWSKQLILRKQ